MGVTLFQVAFAGSSGLPRDVYVNTFHGLMGTGDATAEQCEDFADALEAAYLDEDGADHNILHWMSEEVNTTVTISAYNLSDPEPRSPVMEKTYSIAGGTTGNGFGVAEVALCLSFQGARISGEPQARRRGRIYVGPLRPQVVSDTTGRPGTTIIDTWQHFGNVLHSTLNALAGWTWVVYSRMDDAAVEIVDGWIDNAFDTQRRRGLAPSTRRIFPS